MNTSSQIKTSPLINGNVTARMLLAAGEFFLFENGHGQPTSFKLIFTQHCYSILCQKFLV